MYVFKVGKSRRTWNMFSWNARNMEHYDFGERIGRLKGRELDV